MPWLLSLLIFGFALSGNAHAEVIDFWSLRNNAHGTPIVQQLSDVSMTESGLRLQTNEEGFIMWQGNPVSQPTEVITIGVQTSKPATMQFLWVGKTDGHNIQTFTAPVEIPATNFRTEVDIILSQFPEWNWKTDGIGFMVPAGSDVLLQDIAFRHWTPLEKIGVAIKSFWTFDKMGGYSINFLWGPMIVFNEPFREIIFDRLPPNGFSGMLAIYGAVLLIILSAAIVSLIKKNKQYGRSMAKVGIVLLWVLLDIRMGTEILSYAFKDITEYVYKEGLERSLRAHDKAGPLVEELAKRLEGVGKYAMFTEEPSSYFQMIRYQAYPAEPVLNNPDADVDTYVVIGRNDIAMNQSGALIMADRSEENTGGIITLAESGGIVYELERGTFIYSTK